MELIPALAEVLFAREMGELALLSSLPSVVIVFFAGVTQLADPWFVFGLLALLYVWPVPELQRREVARLFALALVATALVLALKTAIGVPRPPGAADAAIPGWLRWPLSETFHRVAVDGGFGFPSGHATGATVLYGGLAALLDWKRRRDRVAIASVVIVTVMCSRIVLELHFLIDVVAGGVLGIGILWIGLRRGDPIHWFGVAAIVAVAGGMIAALQGYPMELHDAAVGAGSAIGAVGGWYIVTRTEQSQTATVRPVTGVAIANGAAGIWAFAYLFSATSSGLPAITSEVPLLVSSAMAAVAIGIVIGLPAVSRAGNAVKSGYRSRVKRNRTE